MSPPRPKRSRVPKSGRSTGNGIMYSNAPGGTRGPSPPPPDGEVSKQGAAEILTLKTPDLTRKASELDGEATAYKTERRASLSEKPPPDVEPLPMPSFAAEEATVAAAEEVAAAASADLDAAKAEAARLSDE
eukprot:3192588-Prymnesium_polylepis.1